MLGTGVSYREKGGGRGEVTVDGCRSVGWGWRKSG